MPTIIPLLRACAMTRSSSGCNSGSPPEKTNAAVHNAASWSIRSRSSAVETGVEMWSYSLQYVHARLHRRVHTTFATSGWLADSNPCTTKRISRYTRLSCLLSLMSSSARAFEVICNDHGIRRFVSIPQPVLDSPKTSVNAQPTSRHFGLRPDDVQQDRPAEGKSVLYQQGLPREICQRDTFVHRRSVR